MAGANCEKINSFFGVLFREPQYFLLRYTTSMPLFNFPLVHHLPNSKPSYQAVMKEVKQQHMVFTKTSSSFSRYADAIHSNQPQAEAASLGLFPFMHTPMFSVPPAHLGFALCQCPQNISSKQDCPNIFSLKIMNYILPPIAPLTWDKVGYFGCLWPAWWRTVTRTICCAELLLQFRRDMVPSTHPHLSLGSLLGQQLLGTFCSHSLLGFNQLFTLTLFRHTLSPIFLQPHTTLQSNAIFEFHSILGPAVLGVLIACFLTEFCTSLERRCSYFSCHS